MSVPHDRPAQYPGGMECRTCDVIFVGEEWHDECAVCHEKRQRRERRKRKVLRELNQPK